MIFFINEVDYNTYTLKVAYRFRRKI